MKLVAVYSELQKYLNEGLRKYRFKDKYNYT